MAIPQNRAGVVAILKQLEPMILGKHSKGMGCSCGEIHSGESVAVAIEPGGDEYPGQETHWSCWSVKMQEIDHPERFWHIGINFFVPLDQVEAMFSEYWRQDAHTSNPYDLHPSGRDRLENDMSVAVTLRVDPDGYLAMVFDWGTTQQPARMLKGTIQRYDTEDSLSGSSEFEEIMDILRSIKPLVHIGGPEPELAFESKWLDDYAAALEMAAKAAKMRCCWPASSWGGGIDMLTDTTILFYFE